MFRLLIHGARQIVQVVSDGQEMVTGQGMKSLAVLQARPGIEEGYSIAIDKYVTKNLIFKILDRYNRLTINEN